VLENSNTLVFASDHDYVFAPLRANHGVSSPSSAWESRRLLVGGPASTTISTVDDSDFGEPGSEGSLTFGFGRIPFVVDGLGHVHDESNEPSSRLKESTEQALAAKRTLPQFWR